MRAFQNDTYRPHKPRSREDMAVMMCSLCSVILSSCLNDILIQKVLSGAALQTSRKRPTAHATISEALFDPGS